MVKAKTLVTMPLKCMSVALMLALAPAFSHQARPKLDHFEDALATQTCIFSASVVPPSFSSSRKRAPTPCLNTAYLISARHMTSYCQINRTFPITFLPCSLRVPSRALDMPGKNRKLDTVIAHIQCEYRRVPLICRAGHENWTQLLHISNAR